MAEFESCLRSAFAEFGLFPGEDALARMVAHYELMVEWNARINLTRIIEPEAAARFHYAESCLCVPMLGSAARVIDIGTGAGFPGLPIAAMLPSLRVVLVESVRKKCVFLSEAVEAMGLGNVVIANARFDPALTGPGDVIAARAVDKFSKILPSLFQSSASQLLIFGGSDLLDQADAIGPAKGERLPIPGSDRRWIGRFRRST